MDIRLSLMVGNNAFRNAFLSSGLRNVSKAALAALDRLDKFASKYNFKGIEFAYPFPYGKVQQLDAEVGRKVDEMMEKYKATVHLPMAPLHKPEGESEIIDGLNYGLTHGAKQFVIHPAEVEWKRFWRKSTAFDFVEAKENGLENLEKILNNFDDDNIIIGIENIAGPVPYGKQISDFDYLFGKHNNLFAGLCFDTCHAFNTLSGFNDYALTKQNIVGIIDEYLRKGQLVEVHLTDTTVSDGPDKHCALGQGRVPLEAVWKTLYDFGGPVVIEVSDGDLPISMNWLTADR